MTTTNLRRLMNETKQLLDGGEIKPFEIKMVDESMFHWTATIYGPTDTPYEGYEFILDIMLPNDYPRSPIIPKFITPIQHLNINSEGNICADILKKDKWIPTMCIMSMIESVISLLSEPNPSDPLNAELAELYRTDRKKYESHIKKHCRAHSRKSHLIK